MIPDCLQFITQETNIKQLFQTKIINVVACNRTHRHTEFLYQLKSESKVIHETALREHNNNYK